MELAERTHLGALQNGLSIVLAWVAVPFTVGWMGYDYLTAHELWTTLLHAGLIAACATFGLWSYVRSTRTLRASGGELSLPWIASRPVRGFLVAMGVFLLSSAVGLSRRERLLSHTTSLLRVSTFQRCKCP